MNDENKHYRYCFECDKWLTKEEVNIVDWGPQPGGEMGKCWHCSHCRKQLGDDSQIQIFRCEKHPEEILKVWGVLDGENQEKVFYQECPQEQHSEPSFWEKIPLPAKIGGGVITALLGLLATAKLWLGKASKHVEKVEDKLKSIQDSAEKKEIDNDLATEPEQDPEEIRECGTDIDDGEPEIEEDPAEEE